MKKMTFILGYLFSLIFVIGAFFKLAHMPWANVLMLAGVTGLTIFFLPIFLSNKENVKIGSVIKWTTIASLYALLFWWELLRWPGAGEMVTLGVFFLCIGVLPYFFFQLYKKSTSDTSAKVTAV